MSCSKFFWPLPRTVRKDFKPAVKHAGTDCWFKLDMLVETGTVYASLLNRDEIDFLLQVPCQGPHVRYRVVSFFAKDLSLVSRLVFRNGNEGGEGARFRIRSVELLRETSSHGR